jgi:hypothetical protein
MAALTSQQRSTLENAVKKARNTSEEGAFNALHSLAIDHPEPFSHMLPEQRSLRNRLRQKARLLGDECPATGPQQIEHITYELAYETWHKMLFARFLEANGLLMHPDGVAVTLDDCEQLAKEEGFADKWDAAAFYASKMLPAIFRTDDPLMQVGFASNDRIKLEEIIDALDPSIFTADDALGWVYQFWQSDAKKKVEEEEKSGQKIDGARMPAKTQLFTEPYMVHFLIDNTLGAWWVSRNPGVTPPVKFEYLRLLEDGTPAAGKFEGWPDKVAGSSSSPHGGGREGALTSLDPCMGSGHFVASLFPVFASLRMYEEGLTKEEATEKVITENLHGLELDARCTQLAAFNLALTAWKFCGHYKELPEMNLACSGIAPKGRVEDWVKLVDKIADPVDKSRMENGMRMLYDHFQLAPELGSLLDPSTIKADAFTASFRELQPFLSKALEIEADKDVKERGVMAAGIAKAGEILTQQYTLQITNVPYLSRKKQDKFMQTFCDRNYFEAKGDIATVFLDRMFKSAKDSGIACSVMPQDWLFKGAYLSLREKFLKTKSWSFVARLGSKSFSTPMWDFNVMLISIQNKKSKKDNSFFGLDVSSLTNVNLKSHSLSSVPIVSVNQSDQLNNSDIRIIFEEISNKNHISDISECYQGVVTGDIERFTMKLWEPVVENENWVPYRRSNNSKKFYGNVSEVILWEKGKGQLHSYAKETRNQLHDMHESGNKAWGKIGIAINRMNDLKAVPYFGEIFDNNVAVAYPTSIEYITALLTFFESPDFLSSIRIIDQSLKVTNNTLLKIPFDLKKWTIISHEKYPNGFPKPYSDDATQWLFHGHPIKTENPLQVAVVRMLGYRWPAEDDSEMELADEARELIKAIKEFDHLTDEDGIFCIPSVNSEEAGADRLRSYLQTVFGSEWNNQTISQLLTKEGASSANLEDWLRKEFFVQHCKLFQNRPFIWHIWDGRNDGFSALVNYHKLTKDNLSKLIYTYLGDWIRMCEAKKKAEESGAEGLLSAANKLKEKLAAILEGEAPYDIFVRWKPLEQQPIGWEPDLNDGVRLNIRPFVEAGVLRSKFNIKWGIDRGKNPPGSHWGEVRDNDKHLSLAEKRAARENKQ